MNLAKGLPFFLISNSQLSFHEFFVLFLLCFIFILVIVSLIYVPISIIFLHVLLGDFSLFFSKV